MELIRTHAREKLGPQPRASSAARANKMVLVAAGLLALVAPWLATAQLVTGLEGASGSTVGPDGALYVTEGAAGRVSRVDPRTGQVTTFASGLPKSIIGIGGAIDVEFIDKTAYVLVTLVGPDVGGSNVDGIYRVDSANSFTVIADIGAFAIANPPDTDFFVPTGLQFALDKYHGGFIVTDGHHNRVLQVTRHGSIRVLRAFDNIIPTGLATVGDAVFMAEAGPVPHLPENGKVVAFGSRSRILWEIASGAPLLVDVEFGQDAKLYALSQGVWSGPPCYADPNDPDYQCDPAPYAGSPADPFTGSLVKVNWNGSFTVVKEGLNLPTSLEFIGDDAYIVTLAGEVWKIGDVSRPRHDHRH